jgi:hypothetical protein
VFRLLMLAFVRTGGHTRGRMVGSMDGRATRVSLPEQQGQTARGCIRLRQYLLVKGENKCQMFAPLKAERRKGCESDGGEKTATKKKQKKKKCVCCYGQMLFALQFNEGFIKIIKSVLSAMVRCYLPWCDMHLIRGENKPLNPFSKKK